MKSKLDYIECVIGITGLAILLQPFHLILFVSSLCLDQVVVRFSLTKSLPF